MRDVKRILVPIDFSEHSRSALQAAVELARRFGATADLLHVVALPVYPALYDAYVPSVDTSQKGLMEEAARELGEWVGRDVPDDVAHEVSVREGAAARSIVETAKESGADLIVMSTRGLTGLQHVLMGSVAEHVVRTAPCPVLTLSGHDADAS